MGKTIKKTTKQGKHNATTATSIKSNHEIAEPFDLIENIFNAIPIPVFVKDRAHRWILLNDSLCHLQEKKKEELLFRNDYDFFPKEQADKLYALEEEIFKSRQPLFVEEFTLRN